MIEMINRICELSAEVGKAQALFDQKDNLIKQMEAHIDAMNDELERRQEAVDRLKGQVISLQKDNRKLIEERQSQREKDGFYESIDQLEKEALQREELAKAECA